VREKKVSVAKYRGYGREYAKDLYVSALDIVSAIDCTRDLPRDIPDLLLMEFYKQLYKAKGREEAKKFLIANPRNFRGNRAKNFFDIVEKKTWNQKIILTIKDQSRFNSCTQNKLPKNLQT